jgi:hypothetical protein
MAKEKWEKWGYCSSCLCELEVRNKNFETARHVLTGAPKRGCTEALQGVCLLSERIPNLRPGIVSGKRVVAPVVKKGGAPAVRTEPRSAADVKRW